MENILKKSGWYILALLSILPAILWALEYPIVPRFSGMINITASLGSIFGLVGMAMFSLVMILSARLKFFEKLFNGLNEVYTAHHNLGALAFCLILFHPILLSYNYFSSSFMDAALFFLPTLGNNAKNLGITGLLIMILTLGITFYAKLKYQIWKYTHKFMGVAFLFSFFHTLIISSSLSSNIILKYYFLVLGVLAIVAYVYRALFADYFVETLDYTVKNIKPLPDKTWEIEFSPKKTEINFSAGQFVFLKLKSEYFSREPHPFTISSAPSQPFKLSIKELGDYTGNMSQLKVGDKAVVEGPFGSFSFRKCKNKNQIWIAGGVGVTPFISMANSLTQRDKDFNITLYYSAKNENCFAFKQDLEKIYKINNNFKVIFWNSEKMGQLTVDLIKKDFLSMANYDFLICGPTTMMAAIKKQLLENLISKKQIYLEDFKLY